MLLYHTPLWKLSLHSQLILLASIRDVRFGWSFAAALKIDPEGYAINIVEGYCNAIFLL
jgi:hypothetical protein